MDDGPGSGRPMRMARPHDPWRSPTAREFVAPCPGRCRIGARMQANDSRSTVSARRRIEGRPNSTRRGATCASPQGHPAPAAATRAVDQGTFAEYYAQCRVAARAFIALGLEPFDGVNIFGFNAPQAHGRDGRRPAASSPHLPNGHTGSSGVQRATFVECQSCGGR